MQLGVIILAAGKGTRMQSKKPKVLHEVGGKPLLAHLLDRADDIGACQRIVICGYAKKDLKTHFAHRAIDWVEQAQLLGTGHAVAQALPFVDAKTCYFVLVGDAPLVRAESLLQLAELSQATGAAVMTVNVDDPSGYGRMVRDQKGQLLKIVEDKDTDKTQKQIHEVNSGIFAIRGDVLKALIPQIVNDNQQQEYYLSDIVELAYQARQPVAAYLTADNSEAMACNDKYQLAKLERVFQYRQAQSLMRSGVMLYDSNRIDIRGQVSAGDDCQIDINCLLIGEVRLGHRVTIECNCVLKDVVIGDDCHIKSHTVIEQAVIGDDVDIGPFARIRPKTRLANNTKVGNFVETKNAQLAEGSKINHLSYIGDTVMGKNVNIGAGTITCNYDGANKHQTIIGDGAFIGSNTALVAPVNIGENATIAAGSTITTTAKSNTLTIARSRQISISTWQRPKKQIKPTR